MDNKELALLTAKTLDEKLAHDIVIVDIAERSGFADYFVLATANNLRQLNSLAEELEDKLAKEEIFVKNIEGRGDSGWILLDYGDIIVNIFIEEARNKYQIEKVWGDCSKMEYNKEA